MTTIGDILRKLYARFLRPGPLSCLLKQGLTVGENFNMQEEVSIDASHCRHITIGDYVTLAPRVQIIAHDASNCFGREYTDREGTTGYR